MDLLMNQSTAPLANPSNSRTLLVLYLLAALGPFTVDLYLPALPALQDDLGATTVAAQLTLTAATIGVALGQLIVGNWSDAAGRRTPLLWSAGLHVAASVGVALAPDVGWVLVFRLLQGAGAAGSGVIASAVVRDLFDGQAFVRMVARLAIVSGFAPVVAPMMGAQILGWIGWRGLFGFVALYGAVVTALAVISLRETLAPDRRLKLQPRLLLVRYRGLMADRSFVGVALIGGLIVSGVLTLVTCSSYLLQETYGLDSQEYSIVFALNAVSFVTGTQLSARIIRRMTPHTVLTLTLPMLTVTGFAIIPASIADVGGITAATMGFMLAAGLSVPCLGVIGMGPNGHQAGTAAAFLGATSFGLAGLASPIAGAIGVESAIPMSLVIGATQAIAVVIMWCLVRPALSGHAAVTDGPVKLPVAHSSLPVAATPEPLNQEIEPSNASEGVER
jgi:DHA1 family bicyclomycin/chloramphenicol resistance-like MFS transporter